MNLIQALVILAVCLPFMVFVILGIIKKENFAIASGAIVLAAIAIIVKISFNL